MNYTHILKNEEGFVLIVALMIMVILTLLGISATTTSIIERKIAVNEVLHKDSFYRADGGSEAGIALTEANLSCPSGFRSSFIPIRVGGMDVFEKDFATANNAPKDLPGASSGMTEDDVPTDTIRSARIPLDPANRSDTSPHTNLAIWSSGAALLAGSAIQMVSGYEGIGKGAAAGGGVKRMVIASQHIGLRQSEAKIFLDWRHLIGQEGSCVY